MDKKWTVDRTVTASPVPSRLNVTHERKKKKNGIGLRLKKIETIETKNSRFWLWDNPRNASSTSCVLISQKAEGFFPAQFALFFAFVSLERYYFSLKIASIWALAVFQRSGQSSSKTHLTLLCSALRFFSKWAQLVTWWWRFFGFFFSYFLCPNFN